VEQAQAGEQSAPTRESLPRQERDRFAERPAQEVPAAAYEAPASELVPEEAAAAEPTARFEAPLQERPAPVEAVSEEFRAQPAESESAAEPESVDLEPMGQSRPMIVSEERTATPEPMPSEPKAEPQSAAERPAQPAWKMEPIALPSDLVMIETQTKAATTAYEDEAPRPARVPRPRPQAQVIPDEPLQQVETGVERNNDTA
jgi:hypothetical protein